MLQRTVLYLLLSIFSITTFSKDVLVILTADKVRSRDSQRYATEVIDPILKLNPEWNTKSSASYSLESSEDKENIERGYDFVITSVISENNNKYSIEIIFRSKSDIRQPIDDTLLHEVLGVSKSNYNQQIVSNWISDLAIEIKNYIDHGKFITQFTFDEFKLLGNYSINYGIAEPLAELIENADYIQKHRLKYRDVKSIFKNAPTIMMYGSIKNTSTTDTEGKFNVILILEVNGSYCDCVIIPNCYDTRYENINTVSNINNAVHEWIVKDLINNDNSCFRDKDCEK